MNNNNYIQNNNKNTYVTPNIMSNYDRKNKKVLSVFLIVFYITCFSSFLLAGIYIFLDNQQYDISTKDVMMIVNDDFQIGIYGKTTKKTKNFIYKSSNPDIASVDTSGVIHSKSEGETTIIVKPKFGRKEEVINVVVQGDRIYSVEFENDNITLNLKEHTTLKPIVNNNPELKAFYTWKSENPKIVSVSSTGEIIAESPGSTYVKATVKGKKIEARVKVNVTEQTVFTDTTTSNDNIDSNISIDIKDEANDTGFEGAINEYISVVSVSINSPKNELIVGDQIKLNAIISPNDATNKEVIWDTGDPTIATVDELGNVKALKEGKVDISVKTVDGNKTSFISLNIKNKVSNNKIILDKTNIELAITQGVKVNATVADGQPVKWSSSDESIAIVSEDGTIIAKKEGSATIICTTVDNQTTASVSVNVTGIIKVNPIVKIESITLNKSSIQIYKDKSFNIGVSIKPTNSTNKQLKYESSNTNVATVDSTGKVTGKGYGTSVIKVSATDGSGKVASIKVVVVPAIGVINVSKSKYTPYITNIENYIRTTYSKHMQNFAIQNIGTKNETIYFSGVTTGCVTAKKLNASQKAALNRTFIVKVPKKDIKKTTNNRTIMWLKNTGHGQSFDIENDGTIWTNALGKEPRYSNGKWWGGHNGILEIKFKANNIDTNFSPITTLKVTDSSGKIYSDPEASADEKNNLLAIRSSDKVFVYDLAQAKKGKLVLLYSFKVSAVNSYRQGQDLYGGHFYVLTGQPGGIMNITAYNMLGEKEYSRDFYIKDAKQAKKLNEEAEGLKIYNGRIYIGHVHKKGDGSIFDIGVFK